MGMVRKRKVVLLLPRNSHLRQADFQLCPQPEEKNTSNDTKKRIPRTGKKRTYRKRRKGLQTRTRFFPSLRLPLPPRRRFMRRCLVYGRKKHVEDLKRKCFPYKGAFPGKKTVPKSISETRRSMKATTMPKKTKRREGRARAGQSERYRRTPPPRHVGVLLLYDTRMKKTTFARGFIVENMRFMPRMVCLHFLLLLLFLRCMGVGIVAR